MADAPAQYSVRVMLERVSRGDSGGPNSIKQVVGGGITIYTATGAVDINSPTNTNIEVNDAQVTMLAGLIGLLKAGIDTSDCEVFIAAKVAAN